jgi:hypothetical protein
MDLIHKNITKSIIGAATGMEVGLLINFGAQKVEFKRLVLSNQSVFDPR